MIAHYIEEFLKVFKDIAAYLEQIAAYLEQIELNTRPR